MPVLFQQKRDVSGPEPAAPAVPAASTLAPASLPPVVQAAPAYLHPRAARELLLGGQRVAYALKRSQRRSIGLSIGAERLPSPRRNG